MNAAASQSLPTEPPVLLISADGMHEVGEDTEPSAIGEAAFARGLTYARALIVEGDVARLKLSPRLQAKIDAALSFLPFFSVLPDRVSPAHIEWLQRNLTVFDRVVTAKPRVFCPRSAQLLQPTDDRNACIALVFSDLAADSEGAPIAKQGAYNAAAYWQARGTSDYLSGRAVCYAQGPRIINKSMHAVQIAALDPAVARAARAMGNGFTRPNLLDYGCGIGRLAPMCNAHANYFGTDIAPSMIAAARRMLPEYSFRVAGELHAGDLPKMNIVLLNTVLHHNDAPGRKEILATCARLCAPRTRLVLLEDFIGPNGEAKNMFPLTVSGLLDEIAETFGGTCVLSGLRLLGYKPNDYIQRTALLELDLDR